MTDAFNSKTPVIVEESSKGDGWHIYSARGDRLAAIIGSEAEEVAKLAAAAINSAAEGAPAPAAADSPLLPVSPASNFVFRGMTPWDWYAGQALAGAVAHTGPGQWEVEARRCADAADALMAERTKRGIGR